MIHWDLSALSAAERYGAGILLDLSRVLAVDNRTLDVVQVRVADDGATPMDLLEPADERWGIRAGDGEVTVPRSLLTGVVAIAGAGEEQRTSASDRHGRVPATANPLAARARERDPVVSRVAGELRRAGAAAARGRPFRQLPAWPGGHAWAVALTHDIDVVNWWPLFTALRLAELTARGEVRRAGAVVASALRALIGDPVWRGFEEVLVAEHTSDVRSTWFVLCGQPTGRTVRAGDLTYPPDAPRLRRMLRALGELGNEVGLHGSFDTAASPAIMRAQRTSLAAISGQPLAGVRQHFLRMRPGVTQDAMVASGFSYDSTYGFSDRAGFRLGVADVIPAWSERSHVEIPLSEVPLVWMDRASSKYRGIEDPDEWIVEALETADAARAVGGLWTGLWHPNLTPALGFSGAPARYAALVRTLAERGAWIATLTEITKWRASRRALRATNVGAAGEVKVSALGGELLSGCALLDADGGTREVLQ